MRMPQCQVPKVVRGPAKLILPIRHGGNDQLTQNKLSQSIKKGFPVRRIPVQRHRVLAELVTEPAH